MFLEKMSRNFSGRNCCLDKYEARIDQEQQILKLLQKTDVIRVFCNGVNSRFLEAVLIFS
jgi:hypothetical protein